MLKIGAPGVTALLLATLPISFDGIRVGDPRCRTPRGRREK
jgi:hypothetical protein